MTLEKAREWASRHDRIRGVFHPDAKAAVEVIQSLPDKWVDAEKVQDLIDLYKHARDANKSGSEGWAINDLVVGNLESLITPKLPTLADMTREERKARRWMQCRAKGFSEDERLVIAYVDDHWITLWREAGHSIRTNPGAVTPLPGPKLQWPGSGDEPTIAQKEKVAPDQAVTKDVCNSEPNTSETPKSSIKPEDVPADELWLVMLREEEWVGRRARSSRDYPWYIASPNGEGAEIAQDSDITLIHKLVPETHTLPEGMRLADHETLGRIIVSPKKDSDGDHLAFFSDEPTRWGSDWIYLQKSEFTYLDGETK